MAKPKKWFKKYRRSFIPVSWEGWLTYVPFVASLLYIIRWVYTDVKFNINAMTAPDLPTYVLAGIYGTVMIVMGFVIIGVVMTWVAKKRS